MSTILFRFENPKLEPIKVETQAKGYSILELTEDHDIHLNHNCGGVCACSTCHIYVDKGAEFIEEISDKEEDKRRCGSRSHHTRSIGHHRSRTLIFIYFSTIQGHVI